MSLPAKIEKEVAFIMSFPIEEAERVPLPRVGLRDAVSSIPDFFQGQIDTGLDSA